MTTENVKLNHNSQIVIFKESVQYIVLKYLLCHSRKVPIVLSFLRLVNDYAVVNAKH